MFFSIKDWKGFEKAGHQFAWIAPLMQDVGLPSPVCGNAKEDYVDFHWAVEGIENRVRVWDDAATMAFGPVTFFGEKVKVGDKDITNLTEMNQNQREYALLFTYPDVTNFSAMVKDFSEKFAALAKKI